MIVEKIIFNLLAVTLFIIVFMKMIKKNDTSYVYILCAQFLGLVINFIELCFTIQMNWFFRTIMYMLSIILPGVVLWIEIQKKMDFPEMFQLMLAKIHMRNGNIEEAKQCLFQLINKYPETYYGHKMLAELYEKEGKNSNAIDEYIRVTEINKQDLQSYYQMANLLNKEKREEEAISILQDLLKKKPELYEASDLLGDILYMQERYKEAISVYMAALRYYPGDFNLYYNLGMSCTMINDFQRAKEFYDKAAAVNSLAYNANLSLGQIAIIYGDLDEAEIYFQESIKGEEVEATAYYYLAQVSMLKGDKDKAKNYMNVAIDLEPKMYDRAQKEPVFLPIKKEINKPDKSRQIDKPKKQLLPEEKRAINHLSKTCALVSSLNNDDLRMMQNVKTREKQMREKQRGNE